MHNYFYIMLACEIVLNINVNTVVSYKIDSVLNLINEEMISTTISEKSKLDAYNYNDISYLAINHNDLMHIVEKTIDSNLPKIEHEIYYYFYDSISKNSCSVGQYYCNSVQLKVSIIYKERTYEGEFRYEPISI